jgi:predicted DNA-binding transcriptional regulator YafY
MRADRLLQLILLLQTRGKTSARRLAQALEVSERTVYRDIVALSAAGIPVYGEAGPQGGFSLVDSYRTSLTGLSPEETQALFMLGIPEPLRLLGLDQAYKSALLKLAAALPASRQAEEEQVRRRFYLDPSWGSNDGAQPAADSLPHLRAAQQAVWQDRCLRLRFRVFNVESEQVVQPYGLAARAGEWHLLGYHHGRVRVYPIHDLLEAELMDEAFERPADFDLPAFWKAWCAGEEQRRVSYRVRLRVRADFIPALGASLGRAALDRLEPPAEDGSRLLDWSFASLESARSRLLSMGCGVEVIEPLALRRSLQDYAEQVLSVYSPE